MGSKSWMTPPDGEDNNVVGKWLVDKEWLSQSALDDEIEVETQADEGDSNPVCKWLFDRFWISDGPLDSEDIDGIQWIIQNDKREAWLVEESSVTEDAPQTAGLKIVPDISAGLGKSQSKKDLRALEELLCRQRQWMHYRGQLYTFEAPCWRGLDNHSAEVEIRRLLSKFKLDGALGPGDYRALRCSLTLNPEIQREKDFPLTGSRLNLLDGTLDILTDKFYAHNPSDGFFYYIDVSLDELKKADIGKRFENFVQQVSAGNGEIRRQLLELTGIALTGMELKYFFVLLGPSNTGKTQFGRFISELVGRHNVETLRGIDDFGDKWTMGALHGKRLVTCLDLPDESLSSRAIGSIKQLVGEDPVKGEYKGGALFTFYNKPLLLCAGNFPIRVHNVEKEQALLNRMVVIPFASPVNSEMEIQHFFQILLEEKAYIVGQAIEALRDLVKRNYQITRVPIPNEYATVEGKQSLQMVQTFLMNCCEQDQSAVVTTAELYQKYSQTYEDDITPLTKTDFSRLLKQAFEALSFRVVPDKHIGASHQRGYRGLRVRYSVKDK